MIKNFLIGTFLSLSFTLFCAQPQPLPQEKKELELIEINGQNLTMAGHIRKAIYDAWDNKLNPFCSTMVICHQNGEFIERGLAITETKAEDWKDIEAGNYQYLPFYAMKNIDGSYNPVAGILVEQMIPKSPNN